jgi:hypothetical protein
MLRARPLSAPGSRMVSIDTLIGVSRILVVASLTPATLTVALFTRATLVRASLTGATSTQDPTWPRAPWN